VFNCRKTFDLFYNPLLAGVIYAERVLGLRNYTPVGTRSHIQRDNHGLSLAFCWQDIGLMAILLVTLNVLDVFSTFYAINVLCFTELNPLAAGFPIWLYVVKFGACFIPLICGYMLEKLKMKNYLILPFVFSTVLIEFYAVVFASNMYEILGA
jgi:hypothetical protein